MKISSFMMAIAVFLLPSYLLAVEQSQVDKNSSTNHEVNDTVPELGEIIPLVTENSIRLNTIENYFKDMLDLTEIDRKLAEIESNIKHYTDQLEYTKEDIQGHNQINLMALQEEIDRDYQFLEGIINSLSKEIDKLGDWRNELNNNKIHLNEWTSSTSKDMVSNQIYSLRATAIDNTNHVLGEVNKKLLPIITTQRQAARLFLRVITLKSDLNSLIDKKRLSSYPVLFSPKYFSQFSISLWKSCIQGIYSIKWPGIQQFREIGLIVLFQIVLSLLLCMAFYRHQQFFMDSMGLRFIGSRPISTGLFIALIPASPLYKYFGVVPIWQLAYTILGGVCICLIISVLFETRWKKHFIYLLAIIIVTARLLEVINLPIPLYRLYVVLIAILSLILILRWLAENRSLNGPSIYTWFLGLCSVLFGVIIISEIWGYEGRAEYIFNSLLILLTALVLCIVYIKLILGGLEWLFKYPLRSLTPTNKDMNAIIRGISVLIYFCLGIFLITNMIMIWYDESNINDALKSLFFFGFNLGSLRISLGFLVILAGIIYGSYLISLIIRNIILTEGGLSKEIESGVRASIAQLLQYSIITIGFLIALYEVGFKFTQLTIMLSALGIGIGFGLQDIVNNLISGLILLFERPLRVGDILDIGGRMAKVKHIGIRSTIITTYDQIDVIVPNSKLISQEVANLTFDSRIIRLTIPVGVAYGSDVPLVLETLRSCGMKNPKVARTPAPQSVFRSFGESTLNFELHIWLSDAENLIDAQSELLQEIDRRFRELKIEIAFPQRDLHIRSLDESIKLRPYETEK